jgi:hypothetical protein
MTLTALAFIRAHWQKLAVLLVAGALFLSGRCSKKCPTCAPTIALQEQQHVDDVKQSQSATVDQKGPTHEVITEKFACPPVVAAPSVPSMSADAEKHTPNFTPLIQPPILLERTTVIDSGGETVTTKAATEQETQQDTRMQLDVTPAPSVALPRFSVFWEPEVRPDLKLGGIGGDIRVNDRLWIGGWARPMDDGHPWGASVRWTW